MALINIFLLMRLSKFFFCKRLEVTLRKYLFLMVGSNPNPNQDTPKRQSYFQLFTEKLPLRLLRMYCIQTTYKYKTYKGDTYKRIFHRT